MDEPKSLWTRARQWLFGHREATPEPATMDTMEVTQTLDSTWGGGPVALSEAETALPVGAAVPDASRPSEMPTAVPWRSRAVGEAPTIPVGHPRVPRVPDLAPAPPFVGTLTMEERLGQGGAAVVYRASLQTEGGTRDVAVKVLRGEWSELTTAQAHQEAALLSHLRHDNLHEVYGTTVLDGKLVLVGEYIDGASLAEVLRAGGPLSEREMAELAGGLAKALAHLHDNGIVHGDISPNNVMIRRDGTVKLIDLGVAVPLGPFHQEKGIIGTYNYCAPEVFQGVRGDPASDVFAAAATLKRAATGTPVHKPEVDRRGYPVAARTYWSLGPKKWNRAVAGQLKALQNQPMGKFLKQALAHNAHDRPTAEDLRGLAERERARIPNPAGPALADRVRAVGVDRASPPRGRLSGRQIHAGPDGRSAMTRTPFEQMRTYLQKATATLDPGTPFDTVAVRAASEALADGVQRNVVVEGLAESLWDVQGAAEYASELVAEASTLQPSTGHTHPLFEVLDPPPSRGAPAPPASPGEGRLVAEVEWLDSPDDPFEVWP